MQWVITALRPLEIAALSLVTAVHATNLFPTSNSLCNDLAEAAEALDGKKTVVLPITSLCRLPFQMKILTRGEELLSHSE